MSNGVISTLNPGTSSTTKYKTALGRERRQISQAYPIAKDNGDINSEIITEIEKAMLKCFIQDTKNDNPSE